MKDANFQRYAVGFCMATLLVQVFMDNYLFALIMVLCIIVNAFFIIKEKS